MSIPEDWVNVADLVSPWESDTGIYVYRSGAVVYFYGTIYVPEESSGNWNMELFTIPENYRPQNTIRRSVTLMYNYQQNCYIQIKTNGVCSFVGAYGRGDVIDIGLSYLIYD